MPTNNEPRRWVAVSESEVVEATQKREDFSSERWWRLYLDHLPREAAEHLTPWRVYTEGEDIERVYEVNRVYSPEKWISVSEAHFNAVRPKYRRTFFRPLAAANPPDGRAEAPKEGEAAEVVAAILKADEHLFYKAYDAEIHEGLVKAANFVRARSTAPVSGEEAEAKAEVWSDEELEAKMLDACNATIAGAYTMFKQMAGKLTKIAKEYASLCSRAAADPTPSQAEKGGEQ